jgi:hypothetical protein
VRIEVRDESLIQERRNAKNKKLKAFLTKKKPKTSVDTSSRLIEAAEVRLLTKVNCVVAEGLKSRTSGAEAQTICDPLRHG